MQVAAQVIDPALESRCLALEMVQFAFDPVFEEADYPEEYERFVQSTSYSLDGSVPVLDAAVEAVKQLTEIATA